MDSANVQLPLSPFLIEVKIIRFSLFFFNPSPLLQHVGGKLFIPRIHPTRPAYKESQAPERAQSVFTQPEPGIKRTIYHWSGTTAVVHWLEGIHDSYRITRTIGAFAITSLNLSGSKENKSLRFQAMAPGAERRYGHCTTSATWTQGTNEEMQPLPDLLFVCAETLHWRMLLGNVTPKGPAKNGPRIRKICMRTSRQIIKFHTRIESTPLLDVFRMVRCR